MQLEWQAFYLDGKSAVRRPATVQLQPSALRIVIDGGDILYWPYESIEQTQGSYTGEQVRLERGAEYSEALLLSDHGFLAALHQFAPGRAGRFHNPARRLARIRATILAGVVSVILVVLAYLYGIPALATAVTPWVPIAWEESLGALAVDHLAAPESRCADPARQQILDDLIARLSAAVPQSPYKIRVLVVDNPTMNALAAPGGYIVVFRGLIDAARTPEELAGVLAHELQHVLRRHSTRLLLQHVSTGLLMAALFGDASGLASFGLDAAQNLALLRYSRSHETEADEEGLRTLIAAGIDPSGMVSFFETLQQKEGRESRYLAYLSSHPNTLERIDRLKSLIAQTPHTRTKPLAPETLTELKTICPARPAGNEKTRTN
jgi:predicted Zn-dependent protease